MKKPSLKLYQETINLKKPLLILNQETPDSIITSLILAFNKDSIKKLTLKPKKNSNVQNYIVQKIKDKPSWGDFFLFLLFIFLGLLSFVFGIWLILLLEPSTFIRLLILAIGFIAAMMLIGHAANNYMHL